MSTTLTIMVRKKWMAEIKQYGNFKWWCRKKRKLGVKTWGIEVGWGEGWRGSGKG